MVIYFKTVSYNSLGRLPDDFDGEAFIAFVIRNDSWTLILPEGFGCSVTSVLISLRCDLIRMLYEDFFWYVLTIVLKAFLKTTRLAAHAVQAPFQFS